MAIWQLTASGVWRSVCKSCHFSTLDTAHCGGEPCLEALDDVAADAPGGHSAHSLALEVVGVLGQLWDVPLSIDSLQAVSIGSDSQRMHACIGSDSQRRATLCVFVMRPVTSLHTIVSLKPMQSLSSRVFHPPQETCEGMGPVLLAAHETKMSALVFPTV